MRAWRSFAPLRGNLRVNCAEGTGELQKNACNFGGECLNYILETRLFFRYYRKVRVFKYTRFNRFASKEGITDHELLEVVEQLEGDQADANLGGNAFQKP